MSVATGFHEENLNISAAARELRVDRRTLARWIDHGDVAVRWFHGRRYVPRTEVDRLLNRPPGGAGGAGG